MNRSDLGERFAAVLHALRSTDLAAIGRILAWLWRLLRFFGGHFVWKLVLATLDVAWDVLAPKSRFAPGIIRFPLRCRNEFEIAMMSNLITLTPGTLTLAVQRDPATLYVHAMYSADRDAAYADLRDYEYRMLSALRLHGDVEDEDAAPSSGRAPEEGGGR